MSPQPKSVRRSSELPETPSSSVNNDEAEELFMQQLLENIDNNFSNISNQISNSGSSFVFFD